MLGNVIHIDSGDYTTILGAAVHDWEARAETFIQARFGNDAFVKFQTEAGISLPTGAQFRNGQNRINWIRLQYRAARLLEIRDAQNVD